MSAQTPDRSGRRNDRDRPGVPRWVKIFGGVGAVIVVLVVVLLLTGHGPSSHGLHASATPSAVLGARR